MFTGFCGWHCMPKTVESPKPHCRCQHELYVIPAMSRDCWESGRGSCDSGGGDRSLENPRGSRPRAAPAAFEIGQQCGLASTSTSSMSRINIPGPPP